jgi:hypothetical protein
MKASTNTPANQAKMSHNKTFEIDHYTVSSCLNERTIYLKITDRVAFLCYEGNIDENDLRLSIDLRSSYRLMCNCFSQEEGHEVEFVINSGIMRLVFDACVGGYLTMHAELLLPQHVMSNDIQLTVNFLRLEQQLEPLIKQNQQLLQRVNELEERLEGVADCGVAMYPISAIYNQSLTPTFKLNCSELTLDNHSGQPTYLDKVKNFYRLKKLQLQTGTIHHATLREANLSSTTLEHLVLNGCQNPFTSLDGIDKLPNLQKLEVHNCQQLQPFVDILKSYRHKITEIVVVSCPGVNQVALTTYCTQSNIRLNIS